VRLRAFSLDKQSAESLLLEEAKVCILLRSKLQKEQPAEETEETEDVIANPHMPVKE
jgi:hypothetical protein